MDNRIRQNEACIIGLPSCGFVFSSTRSCFIAYGFEESTLEMKIIRNLLEHHRIEPVEAGGSQAPGQSAFCVKICSKIISSRFCMVLLNNDLIDGREIPNANVNMEYGLMLGFNKYTIPLQRQNQTLPFNVRGLDTIKYINQDLEEKAEKAIRAALEATRQTADAAVPTDQNLVTFLLSKRALVTPMDTDGDKNLYRMGQPLGFMLLNDFEGVKYMYFGNFTHLRPEAVVWRLRTLNDILNGRHSSMDARIKAGLVTADQVKVIVEFLDHISFWNLVTSQKDKDDVIAALKTVQLDYKWRIFSNADILSGLNTLDRSEESE